MDLTLVDYQPKDLLSIFTRFHQCTEAPFVTYQKKRDRTEWLRLSIRPGLRNTKFAMANTNSKSLSADFAATFHSRLGVGVELVMPFNRNKWSVMIEPTLQLYQQSSKLERGQPVALTHRSLEANVAVRHYFFLSERSQVFVSVGGFFERPIDSIVSYDGRSWLEVSPNPSIFLGAGYSLGKRWQGEFRYCDGREMLGSYQFWASRYRTLELIIGYRLL